MTDRVTRGNVLLEGFLARKRAAMARAGSSATCLATAGSSTSAVEATPSSSSGAGSASASAWTSWRRQEGPPSRAGDCCDTTWAATRCRSPIHVPPDALRPLLTDIRRVLRPGGTLVITTPAAWTDPILRALAALRLVSSEEIDEHQDAYSHAEVRDHLVAAGFRPTDLRFGTFEPGMNLWIRAIR